MILRSAMALQMPAKSTAREPRRSLRFALSSTSLKCARTDTEELRTQIESLHAEAEITWSKANGARLRLMRLSEAAEKLQRRAITVIAFGKENEARELLIQKRKIMQALEKTKKRLEVLNELSLKINEVISSNETKLISNVMSSPEINEEEDSSQEIRIISPNTDVCKDEITNDEEVLDQEQVNSELVANESQVSDSMIGSLWAVSSYEDFLEHVDEQLRQVEVDLCNFLRLSAIILDIKQRQTNSRVLHVSEILDDVVSTRGRIANIMKLIRENGNRTC